MSSYDAMLKACLLRFRPVMMTTRSALLGGIPLALGRGTGDEVAAAAGYRDRGRSGGSQMLTLFTTPVVYLSMDRLRVRFSRRQVSSRHMSILIPGSITDHAD